MGDADTRPRPERTARAVAAYLLDLGFSSNFLHRWWTYRVRHEPGVRDMAALLRDAHQMAQGAPRTFEVLIAFETAPKSPAGLPPRWIDAPTASAWLKQHHFGKHGIRQEGGMLFRLPARDADSAVEAATELLDNFAARLEISTNLTWKAPLPTAWVANEQRPFKLGRRTRKVHVRALEREAQVYSASTPSIVDAALELLAPLQSSSPSAAVAGGWAAIEALLSEPTDHSIAAERLASLVACSFPRAELTFLSYLVGQLPGPLATALSASATNRDRCAILIDALESGTPLGLVKPSDVAAVERMRAVLSAPHQKLHDIQAHATNALMRLYRQRNLVLHWGKTDAVALRASLRTAAPLVGAGMDRIAHAWFVQKIRPLELAARARISLAVIGSRPGTNCLDLLA
ncbi:MAG: integrase [Candidatus Solibacter sp.]